MPSMAPFILGLWRVSLQRSPKYAARETSIPCLKTSRHDTNPNQRLSNMSKHRSPYSRGRTCADRQAEGTAALGSGTEALFNRNLCDNSVEIFLKNRQIYTTYISYSLHASIYIDIDIHTFITCMPTEMPAYARIDTALRLLGPQ